jgi:hypothetical protein
MQGEFRHLHFNSFPMTWKTPQGKVFWPLQLSSEVLGVPEDSQIPISGVWVSSSHSSKSGVATRQTSLYFFLCFWLRYINWHNDALPSSLLGPSWVQVSQTMELFRTWGTLPALSIKRGRRACWSSEMGLGRGTNFNYLLKPASNQPTSWLVHILEHL